MITSKTHEIELKTVADRMDESTTCLLSTVFLMIVLARDGDGNLKKSNS